MKMGLCHNLFQLYNDTSQECPLFPTPACPVPRKPPSHNSPKPQYPGEHRIAAWADISFYVREPCVFLPVILQELKQYGELSILKVHLTKSKILNITVPYSEQASISPLFSLCVAIQKPTLPGHHINTTTLPDLDHHNFIHLRNRVKSLLNIFSIRSLKIILSR